MKKFFTKALLYNLLIAVGIIVLLLTIVQWSLKSYTRHGEGIPVPDLKGKTFEEAQKILSDKDLEWQIMDSVFDDSKPPLSVVEQNPKAGSKVKTDRKIYLVINATSAPTVEVPDLAGRSSLKYAKMQLESYGFRVGDPIYKPDPHLNAVIGMLVNGKPVTHKMRAPKGAMVTLIVGDGLGMSGGKIQIPYLIGLPYEEAEFKLKGLGLNVGATLYDAGVIDSSSAIVYKQSPGFEVGRTIQLGETIDLFTAKELPEGITVNPDYYSIGDSLSAPVPDTEP